MRACTSAKVHCAVGSGWRDPSQNAKGTANEITGKGQENAGEVAMADTGCTETLRTSKSGVTGS